MTVETYTVMHDRENQPERGLVACLTADGRRTWGFTTESTTMKAMVAEEFVGRSADAGERRCVGVRRSRVRQLLLFSCSRAASTLHHAIVRLRHLLEELLEMTVSNASRSHRRLGDHGGVARPVLDQRHLAHHHPGPDRRYVLTIGVHTGLTVDE